MKTYVPNAAAINTANKKWYIIDAEGKTLGRLATEAAKILRHCNQCGEGDRNGKENNG